MKSITSRLALCLMMLMIATTTVHASEVRTTSTGATKIHVEDIDPVASLSQVLVGSGVDGIEPTRTTATAGGSIHWVKTRDKVDERGHRHVFFRQHYRPNTHAVSGMVTPAAQDVHLAGAGMGLHYDPYGTLWLVHGTQFEDVLSTTSVVIDGAADAYAMAYSRIQEWPGFEAVDSADYQVRFAASDLPKARMILHSTGDGRTFRYIWRVVIRDASGSAYVASVDCETGVLLSLSDMTAWAACEPDTGDQDAAEGTAQRGGTRNIWATELTNPGTYTHEAHKIGTASLPDIQVFYWTDDEGACDEDDKQYALQQVETDSGTPTYPSTENGKSATDAMFFTYQTMQSIHDWGWDGWDDGFSDALVVLDVDCQYQGWPVRNQAFFNYDEVRDDMPWELVGETQVPIPALGVCMNTQSYYNSSAAIDIVAHEFGHGVVYSSANWDRHDEDPETQQNNRVLHEAWADVVAYLVEWDNQSEGDTYEKADWRFGEDIWITFGGDIRRVDEDDEVDGEFRFHAAEEEEDEYLYYHSHPLSVALYLMADGDATSHKNPWCETDGQNEDCDVTVTDIGTAGAGQIMFTTLAYLSTENSGWDDFANLGKEAAFLLYSNCPLDNAQEEQEAVIEAFTAIGYPPSSSYPKECKDPW